MPHLELDGVALAPAAGAEPLALAGDLTFTAGAWHVLLGRRGCGGPAVLDAISGRRALVAGAVRLDAERLDTLAPAARPVARVGLSLVPYPALAVGAALSLPLQRRGVDRATVRLRVRAFAEDFGLVPYLRLRCDRAPVAARARLDLARALLRPELAVLLIDGLGAGTDRFEVLRLREIVRAAARARGLIVIQATADQREALAVADRVVAFAGGRVEQDAAPAALYSAPRTIALAARVGDPGMNLLPCAVRGRWVVVAGTRLLHPGAERLPTADDAEIVLGVRAEDVRIGLADAEGSVPAELLRVEDRGRRRLAVFLAGEHAVHVDAAPEDELVVGHRYGLELPSEGIRLYRAGVLVDG